MKLYTINIYFRARPVLKAYLFGSYSKLIYKDTSDIDIALLDSMEKYSKIIGKLERKYGKRIEAHYFEKKEFYRNKKDPLVKDILKNGIRLV